MIKNNSVNIFFFLVAFLFLIFVSVKQVVVNNDYVQFSYKQLLLSPKTFLKSLASVKNKETYSVSLEEVENYQIVLDSYLDDYQTGYEFNKVINLSTDETKLYFAGTNDYQNWDLLELDLSTKKTKKIVTNISYSSNQFINVYQPVFSKIAYPVCIKGGCDINVVDVNTGEIIQQKPTLISSIPSDRAEFISDFFYDETTNIVGYKNDNPDDNKFYTVDLNIKSQEDSSLQIVFLETAGQDFKFLFYYPETQMMLFRSVKKEGSQSNHPDIEYFLYSVNRPALVLVDTN
jgi:hypothetical protein